MTKNTLPSDSDSSQPAAVVPIVAIGASAGGQEAMVELLSNLSPTTDLAYVYIQHLDPTQESRLSDILGRATDMPVLEARHLMPVEANHLYIIPPDQDLEVLDGALTLVPRKSRPTIHMPIDQFFLSLAERQKEGSIAVVLSGTASDGTLGLRAIKAAGGITFAQNDTARFQSMPRSAVAEGVVDRVLPPIEIARELERLSQKAAVFQETSLPETEALESLEAMAAEPDAKPDEDLRVIIQLLRRATGVDFSHYKVTTISRRIIRRTLLYKLDSLREYADYLRQHPEEGALLYDDLLINVTSFFRDLETMDYIQKGILPQLVRDKSFHDPIRIWVPGCSTGQEAYSIVMLLLEVLGERSMSRTIQVFATDLSESAVAKARLGSYTRSEVMDVSPSRLKRFFTKVDDHYRINKSVRDLCVFAPHNLLKDPPFSRIDLVSCRNLLIYLGSILQRKAIVTFHYALNPSGYLVLGKSETVGTSAPLFSQVEKNHKVFIRKNDVDSRATFTMTPRHPNGEGNQAGFQPIRSKTTGAVPPAGNRASEQLAGAVPDLDNVVNGLLLNQYVPASVVVNQDLEILQFRGSTGLFLEPSPGKASLNLIKMARPSLVFELRNAVHKVQKSGEKVRKGGLEVKLNSKTHYVAIEAVPLDTATEERLFLIIFQEVEPPVVPVTRSADAHNRRIKQLEGELANLREDMRSIIEEQEASNEELQSANEEIISSNEELQSINEELETSKEEIESTNEELLTINQELQVRNDQLSESYQFAEDIFGTIREATLVLDTDLRVKSANPAFYRLFKLNEETTERRLIYELGNRQWDIPELRLMLTDIITSEIEFQGYELRYKSPDVGERILSLNARRVVRQQTSVLLAIEDITEHRRAQQLLAEREAWFRQIADNAPTLIWVTDTDGHYTFINKVLLNYTGRTLEEVTKAGLAYGLYPDEQADYRNQYASRAKKREAFRTEYRLRRYDGTYRWILENAEPMFSADDTFSGYIGSAVDVHQQKEKTLELDRLVQERTAALAEVEQKLALTNEIRDLAMQSAAAGFASWDVQTGTIQWDERGKRLMGFATDEESLTTEGWFARIHPDDRQRIIDYATECVNKKKEFLAEYRVVYDTGEVQTLIGSGHLREDKQGHPEALYGLVVDISDRKQAEMQLQQTTQSLQTVLDSSQAAISFFKPVRRLIGSPSDPESITDFRVMVCNQEFAQLAGQTEAEVTGKLLSELKRIMRQEATLDNFRQVMITGETHTDDRYEADTDSWITLSLLRYDDSVLFMGKNITELKKAEQQQEYWLNEQEKSPENSQDLEQLRQQLRERGELLRSTSHDLRGNFGIIQGATTLLGMADSDEERNQMLDMLQRNLKQTTQMLTEMLDFSRLETGQEKRQITSFNVAEVLSTLVESAQPLADERSLWLKSEGDTNLEVEGDTIKVRRIAQNLLLNALKYTLTGGVTVRWELVDTNRWQLIIADTGPGLPTDKFVTSGEGIGLLIARQLCELLDCNMDIDSHPNKGTRFQLVFPRHYPAE